MGLGAFQWLRIAKEPSFGVVNPDLDAGTAVEGTDYLWVFIDQNNSFNVDVNPDFWEIRAANFLNRRIMTGSERSAVGGQLNTLFFPTHAQFMLDMAAKLTSNNLDSYTFDHYDSVRTRRYLGVKTRRLQIQSDSRGQLCRLIYDLIGQRPADDDPTLAAPPASSVPTVPPFTHQDTRGQVKLNNVVQVGYRSLNVTIANQLPAPFDEDRYITASYWAGRDVDWELSKQYQATTERGFLEAVTALISNQVRWSKTFGGTTYTVTLDMKSNNYIRAIRKDLPLNDVSYQDLTVGTYFDRTAATDMTYVVTP